MAECPEVKHNWAQISKLSAQSIKYEADCMTQMLLFSPSPIVIQIEVPSLLWQCHFCGGSLMLCCV